MGGFVPGCGATLLHDPIAVVWAPGEVLSHIAHRLLDQYADRLVLHTPKSTVSTPLKAWPEIQ